MAYEKSVINININFDNEDQPVPHLPKPFLPRKDRGKDKIATIKPSAEAQRTAIEIQRRVLELQKFRRESQSAVEAPLLVTALIKKTHQRLDNIEVGTLQQLINSQLFFNSLISSILTLPRRTIKLWGKHYKCTLGTNPFGINRMLHVHPRSIYNFCSYNAIPDWLRNWYNVT